MDEGKPRCSRCGGAATFWMIENSTELPFCAACTDRELADVRISGLRKAFSRPRRFDGTCPYCGWTAQQLAESALLGCPICYEALDLHAIPGLA